LQVCRTIIRYTTYEYSTAANELQTASTQRFSGSRAKTPAISPGRFLKTPRRRGIITPWQQSEAGKMHSFISSVRKYRKTAGFAAGCAGGLLLFWVMYGFSVLDPANFGWCLTKPDDTAQHFIGTWAFLRDAWHWPPGLFYGLSDPDPASITVIDGIPLAALLVKLCRGVKAEPFQYLGIWGMICFMLQGGFGFLLTGRFTRRFWSQLAGAFFILLAVPFLTRYPLHTALSSHFLILWALYLMLGKWSTRTACAWTVLLGLALAIHPYLAAMCLAVYAGVTLQRLVRARQKKRFSAASR